ncbi:DNA cytosine methyltransferase [Paenibacillus taichungensis]|uniref:DNA (cytosine-5-)-methyltransferase n=1 Tax=Paenibacillus taichungensis TaxID=484184 RepID=A0ABX2MIG5_9BACL|nr:DNA cytosine methyltransferase [Paenibacillus taichungensis]NUU52982.1 DNA cytosine methyltransferase [Paenibacillus taichungensis]
MHLQSEKKFTALSFFSGGGLLDYGMKEYFDFIWANELNPQPALCYKHNVENHIVVGDIESIIDHTPSALPEVDVAVGGPPCFDFTSNNTAGKGQQGEHGKLIWAYFNGIKLVKPKAIIFENVIGLYKKHRSTLDELLNSFRAIGYQISLGSLNAETFGVAQSRDRLFIVGIRKDLGFTFRFPQPPHVHKTVRDALSDLPAPTAVNQPILVPNHVVTWTSPTPERIHDLMLHPRNQWIGARRLQWDNVSPMIGFNIGKDGRAFLHPEEDRKITVREFLRLMGVDDSFVIPDTVKITNQYKLIGNGVAVPVARALAETLHQQLRDALSN